MLAWCTWMVQSGCGGTEAVHPSINPPQTPSAFPQCANDHRPHCIAALWNSNSSSFLTAVSVALKAVVMKVSVFLMSRPFDSFRPLSAESAGKVTVSQRIDIRRDFFWLPLPLFVIYLYVIIVNNWLHSIWVSLSWCILGISFVFEF